MAALVDKMSIEDFFFFIENIHLEDLLFESLETLRSQRKLKEEGEKPNTTTTLTLDDLPDDMLLHILSFLPTQKAIEFSSLSHKWLKLLSEVTTLNFDKLCSKEFINHSLINRCPFSPLHKFYLVGNYGDPINMRLWIRYAIQHHVQEVEFHNFKKFSLSILKNGCFKVLRLKRCHIMEESNVTSSYNWIASLKSMFLDHVFLSDEVLCDVISGCVNLEILSLRKCSGIKDVKIPSLKSKELKLSFFDCNNESLEISCPNLGSLKMAVALKNWSTTMSSSLGLKSIFLGESLVEDSMVYDLISWCENLEIISLQSCKGMKDLKICSLKLKELKLSFFKCNNGSLEITCPNLRSLEMIQCKVGLYDFKDLSGLTEAKVSFSRKAQYYKEWSQIMRSIPHVESLTVPSWGLKMLALKDVFSGSSLYNLKHLVLQTDYSKFDLYGLASLLELSPNLETMVIDQNKEDVDAMKGFVNNHEKGEVISRKEIRFSLPSLKQVEIKDFRTEDLSAKMRMLILLLILHGVVLEKIFMVPPIPLGDTIKQTIVLHRQLQLSVDRQHEIRFKVVGSEIFIFTEE